MKTAKKIGAGMLSAAQNAEASLARRESMEIERGLPEGHPLRNEVDKQKALIGDLSGLPPGHPLLVAMQAAKTRYEQQQTQRTEEQNKTAEVRKKKKAETDSERRESRRVEEENNEKFMLAAKRVDSGLAAILEETRKLYKAMSEHEQILNIDPLGRAKVIRLKRLLYAVEKGLSECRIAGVRA